MKTCTKTDLVRSARQILETEILDSTEKLLLLGIILGPEKTDRKDLQLRTSCSRNTLHRTLSRLVAMGLLSLATDPDDGRRKELVIHLEKLG